MGKPEGKSPLGIPVCRWEDIIKMDLQKVVWGGTGLIWLKMGMRGGSCECDTELSGSIICGTFLG